MGKRLMEQLGGAKVVVHDPNFNLIIAWHGGHGIHVYDDAGTEVAFWNTGDFANNNASEEEVRESISEHVDAGDYLELYGA